MMRKLVLLLFVLALLPCVSAGFFWDSDTNSLVWEDDVPDENSSDENVSDTIVPDVNVVDLNTGPIRLKLSFEHQIIGDVQDSNSVGLIFSENADYAFEISIPDFTTFYMLDWEFNELRTYILDVVPQGWKPMLSLKNSSKIFRINNLLGDCDPDLFLLIANEDGARVEHLEVGEWITLSTVLETDYFLMVDVDELGVGSFSLDFEDFEISASLNFLAMPSKWEYFEGKAFVCEDSPDDRCLIIPGTGESWNIDKCLDSGSVLNSVLEDNPGIDICIQGAAAHNQWYRTTLEAKYAAEKAAKAVAVETGDVETADAVKANTAALKALDVSFNADKVLAEEGLNEVLFAVVVLACVVLGAFVFSRRALPMQPITHFGGKVKEKVLEVSKNVWKKEGKGEGKEGVEGSGEIERGGDIGPRGDRAKGGERVLSWSERRRRRRN